MNSLIQDTYSLLEKINDSVPSSMNYVVINIATQLPNISPGSIHMDLPQVYLYHQTYTPSFLEENEVIEAKVENRYVTGKRISRSQYQFIMHELDFITPKAIEKNWLQENQRFEFYSKSSGCSFDPGPFVSGLYSVLINMQKLKDFLIHYANDLPKFNRNTGELEFLGEKIIFKGLKQIEEVTLLVKNCNSLISKKEFHEARSGGNYEKDIAKDKSINDDLKKAYETLKDKISANHKLKKALILASQEGFGMFVNQRIFKKISEETGNQLPSESIPAPQPTSI